ncbi:hypothetical protein SAMD00019534_009690 [Acytostelium subglobosum LB1]|uniref:hypothetical protein n=1 Tax=Acytostelium subglobosum LB1 TaxID=1410327 RepID=UPI00064512C2|nr:hypothetical protein SAMD00019534_009690 [Acytostelium subglobosum LB1]GAM17794.1 hypothetical protein SAMD00019534_009690 [Acytostelium subglobosum LB1]|eukprot:XP_012758390.1 hypothetical protein SAMD00019534_009690 [Acytostelium subglobosum LB1]
MLNTSNTSNGGTSQPFDVIKPDRYLYDVILKNDGLQHYIHSNFGFYCGSVDDSKHKEGKGIFLYPTSTYIGNWKDDHRYGDGVLVVNDGYRKHIDASVVTPPSLAIQPLVTPFKSMQQLQQQAQQNQALLENGATIIGGAGNTSYSTLAKINASFDAVEKVMGDVAAPTYQASHDYYSGKWLSSKANGIGFFHFAKDHSVHEDFWRNGVAIRYINQNQLQSIQADGSVQFSSNEELKKMLEDWKKVVGSDDDFPMSKPYLGSMLASQHEMPMSPSLFNGMANASAVVGEEKPGKPGKSPLGKDQSSPMSSPMSPNIINGEQLKAQQTQQQQQQQQQPVTVPQSYSSPATPGGSPHTTKQSFGVITSSYLKNRIENEEKFFISLIMFISKWELPLVSTQPSSPGSGNPAPSSNASPNSNFIIVVPDTDSATFLPLSTLVMQCNIMEKMIRRLLVDPETRTTLNHHVHQQHIMPGGENHIVASLSTASTTRDERELYKLIPFCLDVDVTDELNGISRYNIEPIVSTMKMFTKPLTDTVAVPDFLVHYICDIVSAFKKDKPFEMYFLNNRFMVVQEQFLQIVNKLEAINESLNTNVSIPSDGVATPPQQQQVSSPITPTKPSAVASKQVASPLKGSPTVSSRGVLTNPNGGIANKTNTTVTGMGTTNTGTGTSTTMTTVGGKVISSARTNSAGSTTTLGVASPQSMLKKQTTIENIHQFNINEQQKKANSMDTSQRRQSIHRNTLDFVYQLFCSSFIMPTSLEDSVQLLNSITTSISAVKKTMLKKVQLFKEASVAESISSKSLTSKHCQEYLKSKQASVQAFVDTQEREIALFDHTSLICDKLCKILFKQLLNITIKRLTLASTFIQRMRKQKESSGDPLLTLDYIVKFIKHIYNISSKILTVCSAQVLQNEKDIVNCIKSFMYDQNDLFSLIPPKSSAAMAAVAASNTTPEKSSASPANTSFSLNGLMGMLSTGVRSLDFFTISEPNGANETATPPLIANNKAMLPSPLSYSQDNLNTNISIISPLNKLSYDIAQGNYHLIPILSTCGDEMTVMYLTNVLADTRTSLKEKSNDSIHYLINVLIQTTITCTFKSYRCEVFKTIAPLVKIYKPKDDLFQKIKEFLKTLLDLCVKDDSFSFAPHFVMFLANICDDLSVKSKKEFTDIFSIQFFIDIMERANAKSGAPGADILRAHAAQILIYLSKSSHDNLAIIKNRGGLGIILELCKLGQVFSHTKIDEGDLSIAEVLGAGALAKVHRGLWNGKEVAIKIFNEGSYSFRLEDFLKEVAIMGLINHPNLLKLEGACIIPRNMDSTFMIVTEIMHKGTLWDVVKKSHPLPLMTIIRHALSVARGLAYLHSIDMIHRDIKAANILVDKNDFAKVGDFGLSRVISNINMTAVAGTPKWEAPECLAGEQYTSAADVYSFGMMMYEMVTGEEPYPEIQTIVELVRTVYEKKQKPKIPSFVNHSMSSLIKDCLRSQKKRPTMAQIIQKLEEAGDK